MENMRYRIEGFSPADGEFLVNFYTDSPENGVVYNLLMPVNEERTGFLTGDALDAFILSYAPFEDMALADAVAGFDTSAIDALVYQKPEASPTLDDLKAQKMDALMEWFGAAAASASVDSSLGFTANADAVAKRNVDSLIEDIEEGCMEAPVPFMGYDNLLHAVTLEGLRTLRREIRANGFALYQQKWALRDAINAAQTLAELDAVVIPTVEEGDAGIE